MMSCVAHSKKNNNNKNLAPVPNDKKVIKITRILPTYVYEYTGSVRKILKSLKLYKNVKRSIAVLYKNRKSFH